MIRPRHRLFAALLLLLPAASARSASDCPASHVNLGGYGTVSSPAARMDTSSSYGGSYHVSYDLVAGDLVMNQCCNLGGTMVRAVDAYDVAGVAAGTPVTLTAVLTVDSDVWTAGCGGSGCGGWVAMGIRRGTDSTEVIHSVHLFNGRQDFHDDVTLALTLVAGSPQPIDFWIRGARSPGGSHGSDGHGVITFAGLPAGAHVVSCQGYGEPPTPLRRATWGRLKSVYR